MGHNVYNRKHAKYYIDLHHHLKHNDHIKNCFLCDSVNWFLLQIILMRPDNTSEQCNCQLDSLSANL